MVETVVLVAEKREGKGSRASFKLRRGGKIPGVVYGHKEANEFLTLSRDALAKAIRQGVRLFDLKVGDKVESALIKDLQWDVFGQEILHVDFARVSKDERVEVEVRIDFRGAAPGIVQGGVLNTPLHSLHIECPVISLPESIRVSVAALGLGQAIHVKDLQLPPGVVCKNDPDAIVVQVSEKTEDKEAGPAEQAEPEVIGRQKAEEEEGAE